MHICLCEVVALGLGALGLGVVGLGVVGLGAVGLARRDSSRARFFAYTVACGCEAPSARVCVDTTSRSMAAASCSFCWRHMTNASS